MPRNKKRPSKGKAYTEPRRRDDRGQRFIARKRGVSIIIIDTFKASKFTKHETALTMFAAQQRTRELNAQHAAETEQMKRDAFAARMKAAQERAAGARR